MSKKSLENNYGEVLWYGARCRLGLPLSFTRYILTFNELIIKTGFFNIKEERILLYRVVDFTHKLPLGQRIFGCGTVTIYAKDTTSPTQDLISIKKSRAALKLIKEYVEKERVKYNIHGRDMVGASGMGLGGDEIGG